VLPDGFQRFRYFGFLGNRYREQKLAHCQNHIGSNRREPQTRRNAKGIQFETVMSENDKNLFIEKHTDGYAILRGGVKQPLSLESTQEAAIEKAKQLEPGAAIHVERVRNVEAGGRDKWRRI
jgi:hypothetical protein